MAPDKPRLDVFGERLRELRAMRGLTLDEVASEFGTFRPVVWRWENKGAEPGLVTLCRIADFYGVSVDTLLGRKLLPKPRRR